MSLVNSSTIEPEMLQDAHLEPSAEAIGQKLFKTKIFADMEVIIGGGLRIKAHKCVLATTSQFFGNAFKESFRFKEATTSTLDLTTDPWWAVQAMLSYCYRRGFESYDPDSSAFDEVPGEFSYILEIAILGEKYLLPDLHEFASGFLDCIEEITMEDLAYAVKKLYEQPNLEYNGYRAYLCSVLKKTKLFDEQDFMEGKREAREILGSYPEFGVDFFEYSQEGDIYGEWP